LSLSLSIHCVKRDLMNLALFDFDGTITTREMFRDFLHFSVPSRRLAMGKIFFAPWLIGYKLGVVSGNTIRAGAVNFGFRGMSEVAVRQTGQKFADEILPGVIRPIALERIRWHKARGDRIAVVSGALDVYLSHWCDQYQVDLICSELETDDGVFTGRYHGEQCIGQEKSRRIRAKYNVNDFPVLYAYGDTKEDMDMLGMAHKRYFRWQEML